MNIKLEMPENRIRREKIKRVRRNIRSPRVDNTLSQKKKPLTEFGFNPEEEMLSLQKERVPKKIKRDPKKRIKSYEISYFRVFDSLVIFSLFIVCYLFMISDFEIAKVLRNIVPGYLVLYFFYFSPMIGILILLRILFVLWIVFKSQVILYTGYIIIPTFLGEDKIYLDDIFKVLVKKPKIIGRFINAHHIYLFLYSQKNIKIPYVINAKSIKNLIENLNSEHEKGTEDNRKDYFQQILGKL